MKPKIYKTVTKRISIECSPKDQKKLAKKYIPKGYVWEDEYEFCNTKGKIISVMTLFKKEDKKQL